MSVANWIDLYTGVRPNTIDNNCNIFDMHSLNLNDNAIKYLKNIGDLSCEQFYYENLPDGLTSQILELTLFYRFNSCLYFDEGLQRVVLCTYIPNNEFNIYLKPTKVNLIYLNGKPIAEDVPYEDIIPIRDNVMDIPLYLVVMQYISQLNIADLTFDVNMVNLRFPTIFYGKKSQEAQLKMMYQDIANFKPVMFTDNKSLKENIMNFDVKPNAKPIDIYDIIKELKNQALQSIGIYSDTGKRERLLVKEASMQTDFVDMIYQTRLRNRKEAIEECNKRWNTKIIIHELYEDVREANIENMEKEAEAQRGDENETNLS